MRAIYAKFSTLIDNHVADEVLVVSLSAVLAVLAQMVGLLP